MTIDPAHTGQSRSKRRLRVLVVDDEAPSLADLVYELKTFEEVAEVVEAENADNALRALRASTFDAVFLDVRMPGLDGLELGRVLNQFRVPPPIVYVTAFESHAVEAFDVDAVDYLLKPVRRERLAIALAKAVQRRPSEPQHSQTASPAAGAASPNAFVRAAESDSAPPVSTEAENALTSEPLSEPLAQPGEKSQFDDEMISLEVGGRIRMIHRSDVLYVSASGDYVRLHVAGSSVLVRVAMATLEDRWAKAGFVRIHRSYLVALAHITEVRVERGRGYLVRIDDRMLPVSRRLGPQLRTRLIEDAARRGRR